MALDDYKIAESDYSGRDVSGLADRPALSAAALKARFDSLVKNVVAVKYNGLIEAIKALAGGLASRVTGAAAGNFAAFASGGDIADSGKKASDFADATHNHGASDITSGTLSLARGGTGGATANSGLASLTGNVHTSWLTATGSKYTKAAVIVTGQWAVAACTLCFYQRNTRGLYGILEIGLYEDTVARFNFVSKSSNLEAYLVRDSQYNFSLYVRIVSSPSYTGAHFCHLTPYEGSVTLLNEQGLLDDLPAAIYATATAPRREISLSVTLSSIVTQYEVDVSWAVVGMWFEAIRTDATMTYFLHPIRAICESAGKVKVYLNAYPDAAINGTSMGLKISGWI